MKMVTRFRRILMLFVFMLISSHFVSAQLLLEDNFDYGSSSDSLLGATTNWTSHSGTSKVGYVNSGLEMAGYASTGIGGAATITASNSQDVNRIFDLQTTGTLYASFLFNGCNTSTSGDYFIHFRQSSGSFTGRLAVKQAATSGKLLFGISVSSSTFAYGTTEFDCNTTYLIVLKLKMSTGLTNDTASIFVLPNPSETEPLTPFAFQTGQTDPIDVAAIAIRQGSNTGTATIDGIRIGKSWSELFPPAGTDNTAPAFIAGYPNATNILDNKFNLNVKINELGKIYYKILPATEPAPDIATVKISDSLIVNATSTDTTVVLQNLSAETNYTVYLIAADDETIPNVQASLSQLNVTTTAQRNLDITSPSGGETFYVGDTLTLEWTSGNITNLNLLVYIPSIKLWDLIEENIDATSGAFKLYIPTEASTDSVRLFIADALDSTFGDSTTYIHLKDTIKPKISVLTPFNKSEIVLQNTELQIEFNELVFTTDTGSIVIRRQSDNSVFDSLSSGSSSINVNSNIVNIALSKSLEPCTRYYVQISQDAIADFQDNLFNGFSIDTIWKFKTSGCSDLFFSEYIEGSSNNKALEIFNPTTDTISLNNYRIAQANNGNGWAYYHYFPVDSKIVPGKVWTIIANEVSASLFNINNANEVLSYPSVVHFSGDDARAIEKTTDNGSTWITLDIIGNPDMDPGNGWDVADVSEATYNHTLVRKVTIDKGNINWSASAGTTIENSEWKVFDINSFGNFGFPTTDASIETEILTFSIEGYSSNTEIFADKDSIALEIIKSAQPDSLFPIFTLSSGANSDPESGDSIDFASGKATITVTAEDKLTTAIWTVTVVQRTELFDGNDFLNFEIPDQIGDAVIDTLTHKVSINVAYGTKVDSLVPSYTLSAGSSTNYKLGDTINFTDTVNYIITAEDGSQQVWKVAVKEYVIEVPTLSEVRALEGSKAAIKLSGEVFLTAQTSFKNKKYIQDNTAGIMIFDGDGIITTSYTIGDGITGIIGTLDSYGGVLEFIPLADGGTATSTGNTIIPQEITIDEFTADINKYESELITIKHVVFDDGGSLFANGKNYNINYNSAKMICRTDFYSTNLIGTVIPDSANVTGIAAEYFGDAEVFPRLLEDIEILTKKIVSSEATLSDLLVNGVSVSGFSPAILSYSVELSAGTNQIPEVTYTTTNENAKTKLVNATNLEGDEAARTTKVIVTSEDSTASRTYSVVFSVKTTGIQETTLSNVEIYPTLVSTVLNLVNCSEVEHIKIVDITGKVISKENVSGKDAVLIDVSEYKNGLYFITLSAENNLRTLKFMKQ